MVISKKGSRIASDLVHTRVETVSLIALCPIPSLTAIHNALSQVVHTHP